MSRFLGRSARIVPGPLKAVSAADGNPVPLTALALAAAIIATGLVLIPHLTRHQPAASSPVTAVAQPMPAKPRTVALAPPEAPAPAEPQVVAAPAAAILPATEPVAAAEAAPAAVPVEQALFQLDALPVLEATGEDLDMSVAAPKPPARSVARRSPGSRSAALSAQ